jgi:hypothetical protein
MSIFTKKKQVTLLKWIYFGLQKLNETTFAPVFQFDDYFS